MMAKTRKKVSKRIYICSFFVWPLLFTLSFFIGVDELKAYSQNIKNIDKKIIGIEENIADRLPPTHEMILIQEKISQLNFQEDEIWKKIPASRPFLVDGPSSKTVYKGRDRKTYEEILNIRHAVSDLKKELKEERRTLIVKMGHILPVLWRDRENLLNNKSEIQSKRKIIKEKNAFILRMEVIIKGISYLLLWPGIGWTAYGLYELGLHAHRRYRRAHRTS